MNKKKILWIFLLIIVVALIALFVIFVKPKNQNSTQTANTIGKNETKVSTSTSAQEENLSNIEEVKNETYNFTKKVLNDGTLYTRTGNEEKADIVMGDNYFDTQINDMMINPSQYEGKKVEIEGFYLSSSPYTFVGRYSTSNICQYCPTGYSYMEYELHGDIGETFTEENTWIKIVGEFKTGKDNVGTEDAPAYSEYYYLDVITIEVMNQKGQETVNN